MSYRRTEARTAYIKWAKLRAAAKYNLASSGVKGVPLSELPVKLDELELSAAGNYGYPPLLERLASRYGVERRNVATAIGTSMANYLAMSAVLEPGDEVIIEQPAYDPMVEIGHYLGAVVKRIPRRPEHGWQVQIEELENLVDKTRLIALTNLHNPSGALLAEETLRAIGDVAKRVGARVLVDEVYLELLFDRPFRSAFHLGEHFLVTSSLTKTYGLSGLRCGWILAPPELVERWVACYDTLLLARQPLRLVGTYDKGKMDYLIAETLAIPLGNGDLPPASVLSATYYTPRHKARG